jgi:O-acetylhomoserine/O-acetylserine sulfhydrylase-like pyridoxal-dependent enzyme
LVSTLVNCTKVTPQTLKREAAQFPFIKPPRTICKAQSEQHVSLPCRNSGNIYTRISNPTTNVFEKRMASLEGGIGALEVSSGHAAQATAILAICEAGDHIVSTSTLYGGTVTQFKYTFPRIGINVTLVDPSDPENFRRAIQPNTKIIYGETISNPLGNMFFLLMKCRRSRRNTASR